MELLVLESLCIEILIDCLIILWFMKLETLWATLYRIRFTIKDQDNGVSFGWSSGVIDDQNRLNSLNELFGAMKIAMNQILVPAYIYITTDVDAMVWYYLKSILLMVHEANIAVNANVHATGQSGNHYFVSCLVFMLGQMETGTVVDYRKVKEQNSWKRWREISSCLKRTSYHSITEHNQLIGKAP